MPGYSKNDVVLTRYPFSDLSSTKVRPAIVISSPHESQDVFVVPLTSRIAGLLSGEFILADWQAKFQRALHNPDKRVYLYIVTPAGLKAKSELTYRFLKVTLDFYNQVEAKVQQTLASRKRPVSSGWSSASDAARMVQEQTRSNGIEVVGILARK